MASKIMPSGAAEKRGIAVNDLTGRFLLVNRSFCEITGYSAKELTSRTFQSITCSDDLAANMRTMRRLYMGEVGSAVFEKRYVSGDGCIVPVRNVVSMVYDVAGNPLRSVVLSERLTSPCGAQDASQRPFRLISRKLNHPEEEERRRIARDLHDSTGQMLAGLVMILSRLMRGGLEPDKEKCMLTEALDLASQCMHEVRTFTYLLHPPLLEEFGLTTALHTYVEGFRRRSEIDVTLSISADFGRLPRPVELTLFRIVQEGLANVHRHSGSRVACLVLERRRQQVLLELHDSGRVPRIAAAGVGLQGMRERVRLLGGRFKLSSSRAGTSITVTLPLEGT